MYDPNEESGALRRGLLIGVGAFATGFSTSFALGLYVLLRYAIPEHGWWSIGDAIKLLIEFPFLIALGSAAAALFMTQRLRYRASTDGRWPLLRTPSCSRRSRWRHYRRQFPVALWLFLILLAIVMVLANHTPPRNHDPYLFKVFVVHFISCALVAAVGRVLVEIATYFPRARRVRLRITIVINMLAAWGLMGALVMILVTLITRSSS